MEKQYLSIKQTCEQFNKSLSTIRRLVKETPLNRLKTETLKTGHKKIYIELEYLKEYFGKETTSTNQSNTSTSNQVNNSSEQLIETLQSVIKMLNDELESKNKQIAEKDKQIESFLTRQFESNVIIERLQQKEAKFLDTLSNNKKRKWWQRR